MIFDQRPIPRSLIINNTMSPVLSFPHDRIHVINYGLGDLVILSQKERGICAIYHGMRDLINQPQNSDPPPFNLQTLAEYILSLINLECSLYDLNCVCQKTGIAEDIYNQPADSDDEGIIESSDEAGEITLTNWADAFFHFFDELEILVYRIKGAYSFLSQIPGSLEATFAEIDRDAVVEIINHQAQEAKALHNKILSFVNHLRTLQRRQDLGDDCLCPQTRVDESGIFDDDLMRRCAYNSLSKDFVNDCSSPSTPDVSCPVNIDNLPFDMIFDVPPSFIMDEDVLTKELNHSIDDPYMTLSEQYLWDPFGVFSQPVQADQPENNILAFNLPPS